MTQGVRFEPSDEQRRTVRAMAGYGMPHIDIGTFLDIDAKTLRKHFTRELEMGSIEATTKVAQSLFRMATEGKHVAAAIFWMKARAGWREKQLPPPDDEDVRPEDLTDEELTRIIRREERQRGHATGGSPYDRAPARLRPVLENVQPEELQGLIDELRAGVRTRREAAGGKAGVITGRVTDVEE